MNIDWSLLGRPVDIGAHFQSGMKMGQEMVAKRRKENALRAYMTNPDDSTTLNALAVDDPDMAYKLEQIRAARAKTVREGVERAQTVALGQQFASGDTQGAANAALKGGNTELAKTFFSLDKDRRGRLVDMYKGAAPVAYEALKLPYEQRRGYLAQNKPVLLAQGWTEEQINGFDPVDGNLNMLANSARDLAMLQNMDKIDNQVIPPGATTQPLDFYGRPATGAPAVQPAPTADPLAPMPAGQPQAAAPTSGGGNFFAGLTTVKGGEPGAPRENGRAHKGRDFAGLTVGTPVPAPQAARLIDSGFDKEYGGGNWGKWQMADGSYMSVAHLAEPPRAGEVPAGAPLGMAGNTGNASTRGTDRAVLHVRTWTPDRQEVDPNRVFGGQRQASRPALPGGKMTAEQLAERAIANGADPVKVRARLAQLGGR